MGRLLGTGVGSGVGRELGLCVGRVVAAIAPSPASAPESNLDCSKSSGDSVACGLVVREFFGLLFFLEFGLRKSELFPGRLLGSSTSLSSSTRNLSSLFLWLLFCFCFVVPRIRLVFPLPRSLVLVANDADRRTRMAVGCIILMMMALFDSY